MRLYIGCGLTHVPREKFGEYTEFIHTLAAALERAHDVHYALRDSDPQLAERDPRRRAHLCYIWDRRMVEDAELMVADVSFPSTGLGIEMQLAEARNIPLVVCFRDWGDNRAAPVVYETPDHTQHQLQIGTGFASLMVFGMPNVRETVQYSNADIGVAGVVSAVERVERRPVNETV